MSKSFWAVIAVIIVIFGGILLFNSHKAGAPTNGNASAATNHVQGEGKEGITLIEYGDYQCPYCGQYYPVVKAVQQKYNTQLRFQFRNLPLLQVHQNAFAAARAAEAANIQGKFWQMHDLLYESQSNWSESRTSENIFEQYAAQLGLNVKQFKQDAASAKVNDVINADIAAFLKTGNEESTPAFFLDGKKIQPGNKIEDFSKLIDAQIASKHKS
ncbi:MAG TPA: thioredoxin domain-containing protein [Patescibacteria group bacterium]|nr:thioredoxin domain-containing protein [Patescibacteria group bacterium]